MATQYDISNFNPNNLFGTSNLGIGGNTSPVTNQTIVTHPGNWMNPITGKPIQDYSLTETLQGKNPNTPAMNFDYSNMGNQTDAAINKMVQQGWDRVAAQQDIAAHPEKISQLLGQPSGSNSGGSNTGGDRTVSKKGDTRATAILNDPTSLNDFNQSGMDMDQYLSLIDQEANNSLNYLNQQESAITTDRDTALANLEKQRATNKETALTTKEDAQSAARRLYNELQMGYRQRFGGASSAGEAAQALTNAEQQRSMAANERSYQNAITQVDTSADSAIASAQSEFRNQLLQISQNRTQVESEKLAAKRQALDKLSREVFAIQQQRETFKQNLQLMQEQARLQNQSNLSALSVNPTSSLTMSGANTTASGNTGLTSAIGSINKTSTGIGRNEDLTAQGIYPVMTMIDGRTKYSDGSIR